MNSNLIRFNRDKKFLVFDYETCSLNLASPDNKPWQLAFQVYEGDKLIESNDYHIYWEDLSLSEGAKKVTGFSDAKYKKLAKPAKEVLDHFEKYLYDDSYVKLGHNIIGFDIYIHNIFRKLLGKKTNYSYLNRCIDTLCLAKAIHKEIDLNEGDDMLSWQFKLNSFYERGMRLNLASCCEKYDVPFDPKKLHDALYDIQKNYEIYKKMLWKLKV